MADLKSLWQARQPIHRCLNKCACVGSSTPFAHSSSAFLRGLLMWSALCPYDHREAPVRVPAACCSVFTAEQDGPRSLSVGRARGGRPARDVWPARPARRRPISPALTRVDMGPAHSLQPAQTPPPIGRRGAGKSRLLPAPRQFSVLPVSSLPPPGIVTPKPVLSDSGIKSQNAERRRIESQQEVYEHREKSKDKISTRQKSIRQNVSTPGPNEVAYIGSGSTERS